MRSVLLALSLLAACSVAPSEPQVQPPFAPRHEAAPSVSLTVEAMYVCPPGTARVVVQWLGDHSFGATTWTARLLKRSPGMYYGAPIYPAITTSAYSSSQTSDCVYKSGDVASAEVWDQGSSGLSPIYQTNQAPVP